MAPAGRPSDPPPPKPRTAEESARVTDEVNREIRRNTEVTTRLMTPKEAVDAGAMALFGEKYGDEVRVVAMGGDASQPFSVELCGGTHVRRTGDIGLFKIVSEGSVAAGTRRIEAVTGAGVLEHLRKADQTLAALGGALRAKPEELVEAAEKLAQSEKQLRKQLEAHQMKRAASEAGDLAGGARDRAAAEAGGRVEPGDHGLGSGTADVRPPGVPGEFLKFGHVRGLPKLAGEVDVLL